jgi:hypothetical protein
MTISIEAVAYTSLGTVIGLFVKWLLDAINAERAHKLDLRKRFFDKQLELTIAGVRDAKSATSLLLSTCQILNHVVCNPLTVHPEVVTGMIDGIQRAGERIKEADISASSSFGLFYGDIFNKSEKESRKIVIKISLAMSQVKNAMDSMSSQLSELKASNDDKEKAVAVVVESLGKLGTAIIELEKLAQSLDTHIDAFTEKIAHSLKIR